MKQNKRDNAHDLLRGLRRHPWRTVFHAFAAFSVIWTVTEAFDKFVPGVIITGPWPLGIIIAFSVLWSLKKVLKPTEISIRLATTDTTIDVVFGDIFQEEGLCAIPMTVYFESEAGQPVSANSLHGQFLHKYFGGGVATFDQQIQAQLSGLNPIPVPTKGVGKTDKYPVGSTALITVAGRKFLAFALADADPVTCKADANVSMLWEALEQLWKCARNELGGETLNLPLVGSGLSNIGLPARDLLNLIVLSAITSTKEKRITRRIRIVLHRDRYEEFDLRDVKQYWEER